jgi:Flp pilus assembly protein TadG
MKTKMTIKNQKGASAVEFALVLPLLLVLLFGIVEFSLLLYNKAVITNASREAARETIVLRNPVLLDSERDTLVQNTITIYITNRLISFGQSNIPSTPGGGWIRVNGPPIYDFNQFISGAEPPSAGDSLTVQVRYYYQFLLLPNLIELVKGSLTNTVTINAVTIMRFE